MPTIREAKSPDLSEIQAIYAHWVATGLSSFEETPPNLEEITRRWRQVVEEEMPYLVIEGDGGVVGFAYARNYRGRSAYRYTVENSVYIRSDSLRLGLGRSLLTALIETCQSMEYRQMVAIIGDSENNPSIDLHAACGFRHIGTLKDVGWKFGRSVDTVIMQRTLGPKDST